MKFNEDDLKGPGNQNDLPEGDYNVVVKGSKTYPARTGTPMLEYQLIVEDGPYKGQTIWYSIANTPKTKGIIAGFLKACGLEGLSKREVDELNEPLGCQCVAILKEESWNDNVSMKVKYCTVAGGAKNIPLAPEKVEARTDMVKDEEVPF